MRLALPVDARLIDELEVGLVDDGSRSERVAVALAPHVARGDGLQLVVHEGKDFVKGFAPTVSKFPEQSGHDSR